ncbi:hypothetical protein FPQ18DRAFT_291211 [Pyronema domesticum]|uniref:DUF3074 domain-containing protein n=1 Tax=Pyronema omphalodes (strain CBS 100304) TaxID=1076935 RepID=U4LQ87_PYROM|nr:hypothetical protein FPQ18DRAFT_291211 [Pyronema domesticum]CCX17441.1 Similar to hypothetical protein [Tuber melanosporum Mel28]; acc. no. XP_002837768 [Pyronema omphalodes CBS 100304]
MATDVHEALKTLSPIHHSDFPSDPSSLDAKLAACLADTHTLISSIPPPAILPKSINLPEPANTDIATLQKDWKPVKLSNKENQLGISVFKLPAKDGKGTWFARRSIHTNISFDRFEAGLRHEFSQDAPEEGSRPAPVRGIGKDLLVRHESSELGRGQILQLSAQFPGPSAPRDFVEGCLSSSAHPEDLATTKDGQPITTIIESGEGTSKKNPRQFTLISKPVLEHPECCERQGYVRGTYESVEFIREIPTNIEHLSRSLSSPDISAVDKLPTGRRRGRTVGQADEADHIPQDHAPVDWIMITRSDPGGSVPKWMVERGTPGGIVKDAEKFIATLLAVEEKAKTAAAEKPTAEPVGAPVVEETPTVEKDVPADVPADAPTAPVAEKAVQAELEPTDSRSSLAPAGHSGVTEGKPGIFSALNSMVIGMTSLAQSMVSSTTLTPPETSSDESSPVSLSPTESSNVDDDKLETGSTLSFTTCHSTDMLGGMRKLETPSEAPSGAPSETASGLPTPTGSRTPSIASAATTASTAQQTPEERALHQFLKEKQKLDEKYKVEEQRLSEREKKLAEKRLKGMEKQEKKYRRAIQKANEKRQKEEERRQRDLHKKQEKEDKFKRKEIEELQKVVEGLTKENLELNQRVEALEKERRMAAAATQTQKR